MLNQTKTFHRDNEIVTIEMRDGERYVHRQPLPPSPQDMGDIPIRRARAVGPGTARRLMNFTKASVRHVRKGRPIASDEDIAKRWAVCQSNECGFFQATTEGQGQCNHESCGCGLKAVGIEGLNKLRWADQQCPDNRWGAVEGVSDDA